MEFWKLYLKEIGFWKLNLKEIRILEIEFERGWNCENDLRVRDLKERLNCENWDFED